MTMGPGPGEAGGVSALGNPQKPHFFFASLIVFCGLSFSSAMGSGYQIAFFGCCFSYAAFRPIRVHKSIMYLSLLCASNSIIVGYWSGQSIDLFIGVLRPIIEGYLIAVVLKRACKVRSFGDICKVLVGYVLIEFLVACLMVASPEIRDTLMGYWYRSDIYQDRRLLYALAFRGYGVSQNHLYGFPLAMGIISVLLVVAGKIEKVRFWKISYNLTALCALLLVALNARIGLISILICYLLGSTFFFDRYYAKQFILAAGVVISALVMAQSYLGDTFVKIYEWQQDGILQFFDSGRTGDNTTAGALKNMFILPVTGTAWIIGEGRICQPGESCYSDIGWIRLLQSGGLLVLIPFSGLCIAVLRRSFGGKYSGYLYSDSQEMNGARNVIFWTLVLTYFLATIKGDAFLANEFSILCIMLGMLAEPMADNVGDGGGRLR